MSRIDAAVRLQPLTALEQPELSTGTGQIAVSAAPNQPVPPSYPDLRQILGPGAERLADRLDAHAVLAVTGKAPPLSALIHALRLDYEYKSGTLIGAAPFESFTELQNLVGVWQGIAVGGMELGNAFTDGSKSGAINSDRLRAAEVYALMREGKITEEQFHAAGSLDVLLGLAEPLFAHEWRLWHHGEYRALAGRVLGHLSFAAVVACVLGVSRSMWTGVSAETQAAGANAGVWRSGTAASANEAVALPGGRLALPAGNTLTVEAGATQPPVAPRPVMGLLPPGQAAEAGAQGAAADAAGLPTVRFPPPAGSPIRMWLPGKDGTGATGASPSAWARLRHPQATRSTPEPPSLRTVVMDKLVNLVPQPVLHSLPWAALAAQPSHPSAPSSIAANAAAFSTADGPAASDPRRRNAAPSENSGPQFPPLAFFIDPSSGRDSSTSAAGTAVHDISPDEIIAADKLIRTEIGPDAKLQWGQGLSGKFGLPVMLFRLDQKNEDGSGIGSFKNRGAAYAYNDPELNYNPGLPYDAARNNPRNFEKPIYGASAGNHSQGMAAAAKLRGERARAAGVAAGTTYIYMPTTTDPTKVEKTRTLGGEFVKVVLHGATLDEAAEEAQRVAGKHRYVSPYDDHRVITGQAVVGLELVRALEAQFGRVPEKLIVVVPTGGGGLIKGMGTYLRYANPNTVLVSAQTERASPIARTLGGLSVNTDEIGLPTVAGGVAIYELGSRMKETLLGLNIDHFVAVSEPHVDGGIKTMFDLEHIVAEGAGALGAAVPDYLNLSSLYPEHTVVLVVSGGNIDPATWSRITGVPYPDPH